MHSILNIPCPKCGTHNQVQAYELDKLVLCPTCKEVFEAQEIIGQMNVDSRIRRIKRSLVAVFIALALGLVVIVARGFVIQLVRGLPVDLAFDALFVVIVVYWGRRAYRAYTGKDVLDAYLNKD